MKLKHDNGIVTEPTTGGGYIAYYDNSRERFVFGWGLYRDAAVNDLLTHPRYPKRPENE